jgi:leucyl/phenylalanyl-tRNA---protein transferase
VLFPEEFRCSRSLAKTLRNGGFNSAIDRDFPQVISACAAPRPQSVGTWITPEMMDAYVELHRRGYAHSIETWRGRELVGGLYGVRLGGVFFGESMFSRESDASKVALARLVEACRTAGIVLIDCQMTSAHLETLGSRRIPRARFQALVREHIADPAPPLTLPAS